MLFVSSPFWKQILDTQVIIIHHSESHLAQQLSAVIPHRSQESPSPAIFLLLQPNTDSDRGFYNLWQLLGLPFADMTHTLSPVFVIRTDSLCQECGCVLRQQSRRRLTSPWPPVNHDVFAHGGFCNDEINLLQNIREGSQDVEKADMMDYPHLFLDVI